MQRRIATCPFSNIFCTLLSLAFEGGKKDLKQLVAINNVYEIKIIFSEGKIDYEVIIWAKNCIPEILCNILSFPKGL